MNMYVTSCQMRSSLTTHIGTRPRSMRNCGRAVVIRNIATFTPMIVLSAVEIGPGPKEKDEAVP